MKRFFPMAIIVSTASAAAWGQQWSGGPAGPIYYDGGNVGIGTANPSSLLHVQGPPGTYLQPLFLSGAGYGVYMEIGNSAGTVELQGGPAGDFAVCHYGQNCPLTSYRAGSVAATLVLKAGNVGVGTASPAYKLDVQGSIGATDIYVSSNALPDYVFDADYRNAPLNEVAAYIEQNHHLPGMPSAAEAERVRLSVGEMQNKLLQKVEELTLHMIAAEKRSDQLEQTNEQLAQQNRELRQQIGELRAQVNAVTAPARGK